MLCLIISIPNILLLFPHPYLKKGVYEVHGTIYDPLPFTVSFTDDQLITILLIGLDMYKLITHDDLGCVNPFSSLLFPSFDVHLVNDLQVNAAAEVIYDLVDPSANLIFGAVIDQSLSGQVSWDFMILNCIILLHFCF